MQSQDTRAQHARQEDTCHQRALLQYSDQRFATGPELAPVTVWNQLPIRQIVDTYPFRDDSAEDPLKGAASAPNAGLFYWQLPASEQARLRAANLIIEDEGYLAHDINWGRLLLDQRPDPASVPDVAASWPRPPTPEYLSDAISAILQVAVEEGLDPDLVAARALCTHRAVRRGAVGAIRRL